MPRNYADESSYDRNLRRRDNDDDYRYRPPIDSAMQEKLAAAQAKLAAESAPVYGYAGQIKNQEAPQMDLMSQMRMFQQQRGAQNARQPQSNNPYQQMQDSRFQQSLNHPSVRQPAASTPAPYYTPGGQANGLGNFGADGLATDLGKIGGGNK